MLNLLGIRELMGVIADDVSSTSDKSTWMQDPKAWFLVGYGPYRRLTGHASDAQRLMAGPERVARLVSLFREDASLVECVTWLREIYLRRLENSQEQPSSNARSLPC